MQQWLRKCSLVVADESGAGLDLSNLRIWFSIKKTDTQTPNSSEIRVYNLARQTALKIKNEFTQVSLSAGYDGNFGLIFAGNVKQILLGKESATDPYLSLLLGDGDQAYNFSVVNCTLAAGAGQAEQVAAAVLPMLGNGAQLGYMPSLGAARLPRGKVMYGMSRDYLRQSSTTTNTSWSIQDGKIQIVPLSGVIPGSAVLLTSATGLVETPEQTNEGIKIKCLLNPQIIIGGMVNIADAEINLQKKIDKQTGTTGVKQETEPLPIVSPDGSYKVIGIEYSGDTRGNDWYQTLICLDVDDTAFAAAAAKKNKKVNGGQPAWNEEEATA